MNTRVINDPSLLGWEFDSASGRWEWSGSGGSGGGIEEAPEDGVQYARKDAAWDPVETFDDTQISAELAQEVADREAGDLALQGQIDALGSGGGGCAWEVIETISADDVEAFEFDIPSGFDAVKVTSYLRVVLSGDPADASTKGIVKMRIRTAGKWVDGEPPATQQNPYRNIQYGYVGSSELGSGSIRSIDNIAQMANKTGVWGPFQATFEMYNYENPLSPQDGVLIRHFQHWARHTDQTSSYVHGTFQVRNHHLPDNDDLKVDGMRIYCDTADHTISGTVVVEARKSN